MGLGRFPLAPGTVASAVALPIGWWLTLLGGWPPLLGATVLATLVGVWACGRHAAALGEQDPSECVIDEVSGQWFALLPMGVLARAFDWRALLAAFLLFRLLDIVKPWPISRLERLPGGWGIMVDDVAAGLVTAFVVGFAVGMGGL